MSTHSHSVIVVVEDGGSFSLSNNYPAGTKLLNNEYTSVDIATTMNTNRFENIGSGIPVTNMQPYFTVRYVICISDFFPSSN